MTFQQAYMVNGSQFKKCESKSGQIQKNYTFISCKIVHKFIQNQGPYDNSISDTNGKKSKDHKKNNYD